MEQLEKAKKILNHLKGYDIYEGNDDIEVLEWLIETIEKQQAEIDSLSMAHDELHRGLQKDKHTLIKECIAKEKENKRLLELLQYEQQALIKHEKASDREIERLREENKTLKNLIRYSELPTKPEVSI